MILEVTELRRHVDTDKTDDGLEDMLKAAEQGDAEAQYNTGVFCINGNGTTKSLQKAIEWWEAAANQGYADAQFCLGLILLRNDDKGDRQMEGYEWLQAAAEQGHDGARETLEEVNKLLRKGSANQ